MLASLPLGAHGIRRPLQTSASKPAAPPCRALGAQCRGVPVTLRVGPLEEGTTSLDHEATWLIGHTQHISFYDIWEDEGELYVDAMLHVPCRYLQRDGAQRQLHGPRVRGTDASRAATSRSSLAG